MHENEGVFHVGVLGKEDQDTFKHGNTFCTLSSVKYRIIKIEEIDKNFINITFIIKCHGVDCTMSEACQNLTCVAACFKDVDNLDFTSTPLFSGHATSGAITYF